MVVNHWYFNLEFEYALKIIFYGIWEKINCINQTVFVFWQIKFNFSQQCCSKYLILEYLHNTALKVAFKIEKNTIETTNE